MSHEEHRRKILEKNINDAQQLLSEWEGKLLLTENPSEKLRCKKRIEECEGLIKKYETELAELNKPKSDEPPSDESKPESNEPPSDEPKPESDEPPSDEPKPKSDKSQSKSNNLHPFLEFVKSNQNIILPIALVIILVIIIVIAFNYHNCHPQDSKIIIQVANFSQGNNSGNFSKKLVTTINDFLKDENIPQSSISATRLNEYIDPSLSSEKEKRVNAHTNKFCNYTGIFIFGDRKRVDEDSTFHCELRFTDLSKSAINLGVLDTLTIKASSEYTRVLNINDPEKVSFSLRDHSNFIADFIAATIYYHKRDYDQAIKTLQDCQKKSNPKDKRFIFFCEFFKGNSYAKQGDIYKALKAYLEALKCEEDKNLEHNIKECLSQIRIKSFDGDTSMSFVEGVPKPKKIYLIGRLTHPEIGTLSDSVQLIPNNTTYHLECIIKEKVQEEEYRTLYLGFVNKNDNLKTFRVDDLSLRHFKIFVKLFYNVDLKIDDSLNDELISSPELDSQDDEKYIELDKILKNIESKKKVVFEKDTKSTRSYFVKPFTQ